MFGVNTLTVLNKECFDPLFAATLTPSRASYLRQHA